MDDHNNKEEEATKRRKKKRPVAEDEDKIMDGRETMDHYTAIYLWAEQAPVELRAEAM